ncbi:TetR/AcrR family transcriptional regulator [Nocardia brasiliensis]
MVARKVLTRAETQAQTRAEVMAAAERLFFADGYHATSILAIAAEAGRTPGAVYSNFDSKETLCLEILQAWGAAKISALATAITRTDGSYEQRLVAIADWWDRQLANDHPALIFAVEYGISALRDPVQSARAVEATKRSMAAVRTLLVDHLPEQAGPIGQLLDDAVHGVVGICLGLIVGNVAQVLDADRSSHILTTTIEFWLQRTNDQLYALGSPSA